VRPLRLPLDGAALVAPALGAAATILASYVSLRMGAEIGFGLVVVVTFFLLAIAGFVLVPHVAVALTIPIFALVPAAKVLVSPTIGPVKDMIALAAIVAAVGQLVLDRSESRVKPDRWVLLGVALLLGLYAVNVGGGHGVAWAQGFRLISEPLLLLVVGLTLRQPQRTLRWAVASLVATSCFVACVGLFQQVVGPWTLVGWGYQFGKEVRTYNAHLRSFGTLDVAFSYAAFLLSGLAAVFFGMRRGLLAVACTVLITAGLAASLVRTAVLVALALVGLWLGRRGFVATAVLFLAAATVAAGSILVGGAGASESRSYQSGSSSLTLNGRTSAWKTALGPPSDWPFGRGVGEVGTAAARASYSLEQTTQSERGKEVAVDSGYLATIADVGLVGLVVQLGLLGRLIALARAPAVRNRRAAWLALAFLLVLLLDAVTRASFTGFPTAFLGLLLVGLALNAAFEPERQADVPARRRR
jgi:O-antigen ligase